MCSYVLWCMFGSQDHLWELVLFHHVGAEDRTWVARPCCCCLNSLSHLISPENTFITKEFVLTLESSVFVFRFNLALIFEEC